MMEYFGPNLVVCPTGRYAAAATATFTHLRQKIVIYVRISVCAALQITAIYAAIA
jgi:hypothetical protein